MSQALPDVGVIMGSDSDWSVMEAAAQVLDELGIDVPLIGLAKRLEEVWMPGEEFPVILPRTSPALYLLQHLRGHCLWIFGLFIKSLRRYIPHNAGSVGLYQIPGQQHQLFTIRWPEQNIALISCGTDLLICAFNFTVNLIQ